MFDAHTKPELVRRWMGPREWPFTSCEIDLRPGGSFRYEMSGPDGAVMVMRGTYDDVDPPSRLVSTIAFDDDWTAGKTVNTTTRRIASTDPALLAFPKHEKPGGDYGKQIRNCFVCSEGEVLVEVDLSQVEARVLGHPQWTV